MYEYIVPQEFNQDDRIGNFTLPQAMILGGGVLAGMLLLSSVQIILALLLDIPIGILTVILMYKRKYDMPIYEFAMVYLMHLSTPKLLIYRKENKKEEYLELEELTIYVDEEDDSNKALPALVKEKEKAGVKK